MAQKPQTKTTKSNVGGVDLELSAFSKPVVTKKKQAKFDREKSAAEELAGLSQAFKDIKALDKRMKVQRDDSMDSEYWVALCFQNREMKEEFLRLAKVPRTIGDKYINGMTFAKILGITLKTPVPPIRRHKKVDGTLAPFALPYDPDKEIS